MTSHLGDGEPKPTLLRIAILVAAAVVMPWLAKQKRRLSEVTGNAALRTDAARSALWAYLSLIALGLAIKAMARKLGRPDCGFSDDSSRHLGSSPPRSPTRKSEGSKRQREVASHFKEPWNSDFAMAIFWPSEGPGAYNH